MGPKGCSFPLSTDPVLFAVATTSADLVLSVVASLTSVPVVIVSLGDALDGVDPIG